MTSDGILEKELRERFGVDSIVSHLDGNDYGIRVPLRERRDQREDRNI